MAGATLVVLFNLKPGVDPDAYEAWARSTDLPTVRGLRSIDEFQAAKVSGLLMSDAPPPYQYVEVLKVNDMEVFGGEVASETMQKVSQEFQTFADNPMFLLTHNIEG